MVVIFLGSKSDLEWGQKIAENLKNFQIDYKIHIASAHKTPELLLSLIKKYDTDDRPLVYICVAGRSNALGGLVDANTVHPVINCPPYSEKYKGLDILSSLRMPSGVAPLTILETDSAALAAAKILGRRVKVSAYQNSFKKKIIDDDSQLVKVREND